LEKVGDGPLEQFAQAEALPIVGLDLNVTVR